MRPVIHSKKHYHQMTLSTVTTGAKVDNAIITSVETILANLNNEVAEGAVVKACYVELWVIGSVSNQFFTIVLAKQSGGTDVFSTTELADLGGADNKKNILFTSQGLASNDGIAAPIPVMRGWYKIPKSKQRFGLGDKLTLQVMSRGSDDIIFCGFATYKEYT